MSSMGGAIGRNEVLARARYWLGAGLNTRGGAMYAKRFVCDETIKDKARAVIGMSGGTTAPADARSAAAAAISCPPRTAPTTSRRSTRSETRTWRKAYRIERLRRPDARRVARLRPGLGARGVHHGSSHAHDVDQPRGRQGDHRAGKGHGQARSSSDFHEKSSRSSAARAALTASTPPMLAASAPATSSASSSWASSSCR